MIAILMTCHNRREKTLAALRGLKAAIGEGERYGIYLVDGGSSDGTPEAVLAEFPDAVVLAGLGELYWNEGTRRAWQRAIADGPDFYLWLNDDMALEPGSVSGMLALHAGLPEKSIVVGRTVHPVTGETTYGGYRRKENAISRLSFHHLLEGERDCVAMNGNCVLFPASVVGDVGINSPNYRHQMGDIDYGLRAARAGYGIVQCERPVAKLARNAEDYGSAAMLAGRPWSYILGHPKGLPWREWGAFCMAHGGPLWPVNFALAYWRVAVARWRRRLSR